MLDVSDCGDHWRVFFIAPTVPEGRDYEERWRRKFSDFGLLPEKTQLAVAVLKMCVNGEKLEGYGQRVSENTFWLDSTDELLKEYKDDSLLRSSGKMSFEQGDIDSAKASVLARWENHVEGAYTDTKLDDDEHSAVVGFLANGDMAKISELTCENRRKYGHTERYPLDALMDSLYDIWFPPPLPPPGLVFFRSARSIQGEDEWGLYQSDEFRKCVKKIQDKTLRGRMFDAITDLFANPMVIKGDTVKPLEGDKKGCWRYRIGDYRLIYFPIIQTKRIVLISFGGRGHVYGQ